MPRESVPMVPDTMHAMLLVGHGEIDQLVYRNDVATPRPGPGEVLVRVTATAMTEIGRASCRERV